MSELEDAVATLERAVARLEATPPPGRIALRREAELAAASAAVERRIRERAGALIARVDAALDRIGQALGEDG